MLDCGRRQFLKGLSSIALMPLLPASAQQSWDVLVLGAGISGLSAASWLRKEGYRVAVLEARQRLGGRLWSDTSLGFPVDMGASWIHEASGNPITDLCTRAGIQTKVDADHWQLRKPDGTPLPDSTEDQLDRLNSWLSQQRQEGAAESLRGAANRALAGRTLSTGEKLLLRRVYHGFATEFAALPEDVSAAAGQDEGFKGADRVFPQGYAQVAQYLAKGVPVQFGQVVERVTWNQSGVEVMTRGNRWRARRVIVTLPLGVLQSGSVVFSPALPQAQKSALRDLKMGLLNKLVVTFSEAFWPHDYQHFANLSEETGVLGEIANLHSLYGRPGLLLFLAGRPAWQRESWNNGQLRQEAMELIRRLFSKPQASPQAFLASRWGSDPYSRGSYSYLPPGVSADLRSALAEPQPPLFFAGEATHKTMSATVHGAYLSGQRAAKEVKQDG